MSKYLLECIDCQKRCRPGEVEYVCPSCAAKQKEMEPLLGLLRCVYDYEVLAKNLDAHEFAKRAEGGFERYIELLPLESADSLPPLISGRTPLRPVTRLRRELSLNALWIKDDTGLPTSSFKDRASAVVVACARERGRDTVCTASTGNAATALAGQAASVDVKSVIFVPASAPPAKLAQIAVYGGRLIPIKGTYDEAFELSIKASDAFGWYNRNTAYNPFTVEGKKTAAIEIWEQLGYKSPDWVVVPAGDGVILAGIEKGFSDLAAAGFIDRVPKLAIVQAAGCQPLVEAIQSASSKIVPELNPTTIADSISVGVPRAGRWALKAIASNGGAAVAVGDDEILDAIAFLGRMTGIFAEPAAATAIAGLRRLAAEGAIKGDETVVALVTGNGLKDVPAASKSVSFPKPIEPTIDAVRRAIAVRA